MKPILSKIGAFDATKDHTFQFAAYADIDIIALIVFDTPTGSILQGDTLSKACISLVHSLPVALV